MLGLGGIYEVMMVMTQDYYFLCFISLYYVCLARYHNIVCKHWSIAKQNKFKIKTTIITSMNDRREHLPHASQSESKTDGQGEMRRGK